MCRRNGSGRKAVDIAQKGSIYLWPLGGLNVVPWGWTGHWNIEGLFPVITVFPAFTTDKCLQGNLIEVAMFSSIWFAKQAFGTKCWAFSDCWHTYLAIGILMKTAERIEKRVLEQQQRWEECVRDTYIWSRLLIQSKKTVLTFTSSVMMFIFYIFGLSNLPSVHLKFLQVIPVSLAQLSWRMRMSCFEWICIIVTKRLIGQNG